MKSESRLRSARRNRGWTQRDLIDALITAARRLGVESPSRASWKTLISMYENGRRAVGDEHRLLFREVYQTTNERLGLTEPRPPLAHEPSPLPAPPLRTKLLLPISPDMLSYLTSLLEQHAQAEPLVGPQFLVAPSQ